ncbi:MAG: hypothetical protein EGP80_04755 [Blautia wexlerae]|nr:hypothetical protein [Blautia wexlerae]
MKYPAKWGVQIAGMIFQTHSSANAFKRLAIEIKAAENLNNNFSRLYMMMFRSKGIQPLT